MMRRVTWQRLWYEARVMGAWNWYVLAMMVLIGVAGVSALIVIHAPGTGLVWLGAQFLVALTVGMVSATQGDHDATLELQLTLPTAYEQTMSRRCVLLCLWTALLSLAASAGLVLVGVPLMIMPHAALALLWLALMLQGVLPLICFGGVGLSATLLMQSSTGSAALLAGLWVALLFLAIGASLSWHSWLLFYTSMALVSGGSLALSRWQLHDTDRLLRGVTGA